MADISKLLGLDDPRKRSTIRASMALKTIYLNVPKAGCTTVKRALWEAAGGKNYANTRQFNHEKYSQAFTYQNDDLIDISKHNPFVFTIVRNPYARVYSCYVNKVLGPINNREKIIIKGLEEGFLAKGKTSFADFLRYIKETPDSRRNQHFRSISYQTNWGYITPDYIGSLENMDESMSFVGSKIKHVKTLNTENTNSQHSKLSVREAYKKEHINLVGEIYAEDFVNFSYSKHIDDIFDAPK